MNLEHLLNADFDLSLRPRWTEPTGRRARRRIDDLAWHAIHLAEPGDSVAVGEPAPDDYARALERAGLVLPALTIDPTVRAEQRLSPFGWSRAAAERNGRYRRPVRHPALDTVARVNGRRFSAHLEAELGDDGHVAGVATSVDELDRLLRTRTAPTGGWVVKSEHGNAGLGNRRIRPPGPGDGDLGVIRRLLAEDDAVVVERWRPRLRDLCVTFEVGEDGGLRSAAVHETVNTADGAFLGALFEADHAPLADWRDAMLDTAARVAARLAGEGYTGPACLDGFVWDDHGTRRLRPLVDLNARRQMSAGAAALWRRLGERGAAYWRFFNRRKLVLPDTYTGFERAMGDDRFDPLTKTGALVTAPLWLGPDRRTPDKAALLMLGRDRHEVLAIDRRVRRRFER